MKVLIIEDDPTLSKNISEALAAEGMNTECVYDGLMAERILKKNHLDCIVMDINLPWKNGFDLCKDFRQHNTATPVIMLTAFSELEDKIQGFDCGADYYLTKSFYMRELLMRIHSLMKRFLQNTGESSRKNILVAGDIILNDAQKKVFRQGKRNVLIGIFLFISASVILFSQFLTKKLSKPLTALTEKPKNNNLGSETDKELVIETSTYEIEQLTYRFNKLLKRTNDAFAFQKHTIHHISHQLKTPIAVIVSELEKIGQSDNIEEVKPAIQNQIIKAKSLGNIIHVLLEILKIEAGQEVQKQAIRIDEIIFDVIAELNIIYPDFRFEVNYKPEAFDENRLIVNINQVLIRQAFQNLLSNFAAYSDQLKAEIKLDCSSGNNLKVSIINKGTPISAEEEKLLFNHFFRGENSRNKTGFGLGLVLTKKIMELSSARIFYSNPEEKLNVFELRFPLS